MHLSGKLRYEYQAQDTSLGVEKSGRWKVHRRDNKSFTLPPIEASEENSCFKLTRTVGQDCIHMLVSDRVSPCHCKDLLYPVLPYLVEKHYFLHRGQLGRRELD